MRRPATALAAVAFAAVTFTGPLATTASAGPAPIRCEGSAPSPECALLDDLAAQLGPLAPVLSFGGPVVGQLAAAVQGFAVQADGADGVPTAVVADQAQALLDQLAVLPQPVRGLLAAAQLDGLAVALEALVAEATSVAETVTSPPRSAAPAPPSPAGQSGPPPAAPVFGATALGSLPSLGGSLSEAGVGDAARTTVSPAIPDVPIGDPLTLAPLALPEFRPSSALAPEPVAELGSSAAAAGGAVDAVQLAAEEGLPRGNSSPEVVVVVLMTVLLLGAAYAAQARQNRHTIPD